MGVGVVDVYSSGLANTSMLDSADGAISVSFCCGCAGCGDKGVHFVGLLITGSEITIGWSSGVKVADDADGVG